MSDIPKSNLQARKQKVVGSIMKAKNMQYQIVLDMQSKGYDIMESNRKEYQAALDLYTTYDTLFKTELQCKADIDLIEWLFNDGLLRSEKELNERKRIESAKRNLWLDVSDEKCNLAHRISTHTLLAFALAPIIPFILLCTFAVSFYAALVCWAFYDITYIISIVIHWIVVGFLSEKAAIKSHKNITELYKNANEKAPIDTDLLTISASYGLFLASIFSTVKKMK